MAIQKEIIEPGTVFKHWKVIGEVDSLLYNTKDKNKYRRKISCECMKCNNIYEVYYSNLKNKNKCFCCKNCAYGDLSNQKFGKLLVIEKHSQDKTRKWQYRCKCSCGTEIVVYGIHLISGRTTSCGCYRKERLSGKNNYNWKGGVTSENERRRKLEKHVKKLSKERDNYTCQKCDKKGGKLESHHIFDFDHYPELQNNIYNFITLCRKCHQRSKKNKHSFHSIYPTRKENTLNDLETWLGHKFKYHQSLLNYYEYYYQEIY
ncbi:MAG: HNH endonuclease [Candidatus Riesia sp.]|nr:HNH endonuclease [Candidatus Riesia sp.]